MPSQAHRSILDLQLMAVSDDKDVTVRTKVAAVSRHAAQGPFSHESIDICVKTSA